ncbi:MAG: TOPRIM domain-containing protein [Nitrosopumilales archaeon]|nr:MAG: TOPRIM domain-containing protein [Nitrosopumilales archaeon]
MRVTEQEVQDVRNFILLLNSQVDSVVIVEGKRDSAALKKLGFSGKVLELHKFGGMIKFVDSVAKYQRLIILLDGDRKGRYLTGKIIEQLQHRTKVDLSFKRKLVSITKGKIRFIEQLACYESFFS